MASIADIVVKKNDAVTDITYTGVQPSSGDNTPAIWKSKTVGTAAAHQPELRVSGREASKGAKRALRATFKYPQIATNSTTGVTSVIDYATFAADWVVPKSMATADVSEFASQIANLVYSTLMKTMAKEGYAAS